ncbi:unnamed protein product [Symbiodinium necroappetens]|uniref:Uncharacterized protein n=1 Tax=Symbiodinium necroappetens TaxID=1628268 RepID=A0A813AD87_9DINO|nr:unnamed protein product [Symbiodinium necroappetens]
MVKVRSCTASGGATCMFRQSMHLAQLQCHTRTKPRPLRAWVAVPSRASAATSHSLWHLHGEGRCKCREGRDSHCRLASLVVCCRWRTGLAILVMLMFPQLVALCWALVVKLIIRGAWALITQVCQLMQQIMADAAEIDEGLIMWLSQQLGVVQQPATPLCLVLDKQPSSSASATCDPPF